MGPEHLQEHTCTHKKPLGLYQLAHNQLTARPSPDRNLRDHVIHQNGNPTHQHHVHVHPRCTFNQHSQHQKTPMLPWVLFVAKNEPINFANSEARCQRQANKHYVDKYNNAQNPGCGRRPTMPKKHVNPRTKLAASEKLGRASTAFQASNQPKQLSQSRQLFVAAMPPSLT